MTKNALRSHFKQQRRNLTHNAKITAERAIGQHWQQRQPSLTKIGSYLATGVECATAALHKDCWQQQQQHIFIPLITQPGYFRELHADSRLMKTALGIQEPLDGPLVTVDHLDLLLIPLLAIDQQGYRLGYGGGFYDQLLAQCTKKPLLIGVGFQEQWLDTLPHDPWDIPLDGFLSEKGWYFFNP